MIAEPVLVDTHTFIWYLKASPRLSVAARAAIDAATTADIPVLVSAVTLVELCYLVDKGTFSVDDYAAFLDVVNAEDSSFEVVPMDAVVAQAVSSIPRSDIGDPFDRMIAATAIIQKVSLITRDGLLRKLRSVTTIW